MGNLVLPKAAIFVQTADLQRINRERDWQCKLLFFKDLKVAKKGLM